MKDSVRLVGTIENIIYTLGVCNSRNADWSWGKNVRISKVSNKTKIVARDQQPKPIAKATCNHIFTVMTTVKLFSLLWTWICWELSGFKQIIIFNDSFGLGLFFACLFVFVGRIAFNQRPLDVNLHFSPGLWLPVTSYYAEKLAAALQDMGSRCTGRHLLQHIGPCCNCSKSDLSFLLFTYGCSFSLPMFQGLYVFVVYFILHNQLCCPVKASYTVDMNGHSTPGSAFFTHGSGLPAAGGEISKSTQNLISAMEEVTVLYSHCIVC